MLRLARTLREVAGGLWIVGRRFRTLDAAQRSAHIAAWSRRMLDALGVALQVEGAAPAMSGLLVANHVSWLDILALHAVCPHARFVSKSEVGRWPLLGWMIHAVGTLFIERARKRDALRVVHQVAAALQAGDTVAVFPEGTTSDGTGVLPFHANLLQAAIVTGSAVLPVALRFADARCGMSPAAAFVGDTTLPASLWAVARARDLTAHVVWLAPVPTTGSARRDLAETLRRHITTALETSEPPSRHTPTRA